MNFKNTKIKNTKIVATMGPTFDTQEEIRKMLMLGVNVVRLNTSHGDFEEHGNRIKNLKAVRKELNLPVSILLDTKGPEIRIHAIENKKMNVKINDKLIIHSHEEILGSIKENIGNFSVTYTDLSKTVKKDQLIMVDDGKLTLKVTDIDVKKGLVTTIAKNNHFIGTKKAVNIPGAILTLPFIAKYDKDFIIWGIKQGIDWVAASFVSSANDIQELRILLDNNDGKNVKIMSKVESLKSIDNINEIIIKSDGIMLARGDLGVEIPYYKVPFYENLIIQKSRAWGKPIIIATQMLDSMMDNPRPTRAEVTDVYYAVQSGTDGTMLSGESASGNFPLDSVETMSTINLEAESNFDYLRAFDIGYATTQSLNANIVYELAKTALTKNVDFIIIFSEKGRLVNALSRFRPPQPVLALIKTKSLVTEYGPMYGVYAQYHSNLKDYHSNDKIKNIALEAGIDEGSIILVAIKDEQKIIKI